jgi:LmbE family N-acetylglucosaminyl deacetylase
LPPILSRYPAIEFFNGADIIDAITVRDQEDLELHKEEQRNKKYKREETEDRLEVLLIRLDPEFVVPLRGARQSIDSKNPDHVRHFATSLRELFTHVLHTLATDEKVMAWSTSSEHYHNGKPTRRVRLLYICQNLNQEPFSAFLEKDIDAGLAFLKLFQGGTHKIAPRYTDSQLRIMLIRMEYLLTFILETWSLDK